MKLSQHYIRSFALLAILALFLVTFGLAAMNKWIPAGIPDGFINRFSDTWMGALPGGLFLPYYSIAISETIAVILFVISLIRREFLVQIQPVYLSAGLLLSLFIFVILSYGLRLTGDFGGAANTFFYFGATLLCLIYVSWVSTKEDD